MKTAIIYATKTKHSKKLAEAIASALNLEAKNMTENPDLQDTSFLFIVSGIYGGVSMPALLDYIKNLKAPLLKKAAIVTSCASGKQKQVELHRILEEKGIQVIDEFVCKGNFLFVAIKHPNDKDLQNAIEFARKVLAN